MSGGQLALVMTEVTTTNHCGQNTDSIIILTCLFLDGDGVVHGGHGRDGGVVGGGGWGGGGVVGAVDGCQVGYGGVVRG